MKKEYLYFCPSCNAVYIWYSHGLPVTPGEQDVHIFNYPHRPCFSFLIGRCD